MIITLKLWLPEELDPYDRRAGANVLAQQLSDFSDTYYPDLQVEVTVKKAHGRGGLLDFMRTARDAAPSILPDLVVLGRRGGTQPGVPVFFVLRKVMETCTTVEEAAELMKQTKRTVLQNYMLADSKTAAALETGPQRFRRRDLSAGQVAVANHFDPDKHPKGRYAKLIKAAKQGGLGVDELKKVLKDVALGDLNVQAVVFEPGQLVVHLATRSRPAAKGPFHKLDLSPYLKGK